MTRKNGDDLQSSLHVMKLEDTPWQVSISLSQKRPMGFSPASGSSSKQRRICVDESYISPLKHLGKTNTGSSQPTNLDDSVILLEELTSSSALDKLSEKKRPVCADDSIIILSDNEGESTATTNVKRTKLGTILEDDLSPGCSRPTRIKKDAKVITRRQVQHRFPIPPCCRSHLKSNGTANKVPSPERKCSTSRQCSKSNMVALESISIDSEGENTIPNDDSSASNIQADIITIYNSLAMETNRDVSLPTNSKAIVGQINSPSTESSSPAVKTGDNVSNKRRPDTGKGLAEINVPRKKVKRRRHGGFRIDRKGDFDVSASGSESIQHVVQEKKIRPENIAMQNPNFPILKIPNLDSRSIKHVVKKKKIRSENIAMQNPNWVHVVNDYYNKGLPVNRQNAPVNMLEVTGLKSYHMEETVNKAPGSLRDIVIDGCNIAMGYSTAGDFSEVGLKLVIDYFQLRGHNVKAFFPHHTRSRQHKVLERFFLEGVVVFTPSRRIGGKHITPYDDRFILDYATMCQGIVVSQDQYRDLYNEKPEWNDIIENRLLVPTFVGKGVMFPDDPLGRHGPKLEEFLRH